MNDSYIHTAVHEGMAEPADVTKLSWRPWKNVSREDRALLPGMVLNQHMRFRGGLADGERLSVRVYVCDGEVKPPAVVRFTGYVVSKEKAL